MRHWGLLICRDFVLNGEHEFEVTYELLGKIKQRLGSFTPQFFTAPTLLQINMERIYERSQQVAITSPSSPAFPPPPAWAESFCSCPPYKWFLASSYHTLWSPHCNRWGHDWCWAVVPYVSWFCPKDSRRSKHGAATRRKRREGAKQHWYSWGRMAPPLYCLRTPITQDPKSDPSKLPWDPMPGSFLFTYVLPLLSTPWKPFLPLALKKIWVKYGLNWAPGPEGATGDEQRNCG